MSYLLRRATAADLDGIMAIERTVFATDAWPADMMRHELEGDHTYYLVVVDDARPDEVLAYAGLLAPAGSDQGDIQTIAVDAAHRGMGLGRALMHALIAEARRRRAIELFLEVRADNPVAQALYESLDFTRIGLRRGYYQPDGVDAITMRLEVPPAVTMPADAQGAAR
jgi:ribosomal-protein-alanine acetyltransferase